MRKFHYCVTNLFSLFDSLMKTGKLTEKVGQTVFNLSFVGQLNWNDLTPFVLITSESINKIFRCVGLVLLFHWLFPPPPLPTSHRWLLFLHLWHEYIFPVLSFVFSHVYPRCSWQPLHAFQCVASKTLMTTWWKLFDVSKRGRISPLWTVCFDTLFNPTEIMPMKKFFIHNKRKQMICSSFNAYSRWPQKCYCKGMG